MFESGYLRLRLRGLPLRLHWSILVGALVFSRLRVAPVFWLGYVLLVLWHELGHALVVRACRQRVLSIEVTGLGGLCHWRGAATPTQRALIAWGGIFAQALLLAAALLTEAFAGPLTAPWQQELYHAFTEVNVWLMLINLLPVAPLDGAEAWALFPRLGRRLAKGRWRLRLRKQEVLVKLEAKAVRTLDERGLLISERAKREVDEIFAEIDRQRGVTPKSVQGRKGEAPEEVKRRR